MRSNLIILCCSLTLLFAGPISIWYNTGIAAPVKTCGRQVPPVDPVKGCAKSESCAACSIHFTAIESPHTDWNIPYQDAGKGNSRVINHYNLIVNNVVWQPPDADRY